MGFNDIDIKVSGGSDIISTLKTYTTRILKPNIVDGKNVLTQEMFSSKNTKYVIKYVYELLDATLTMPQNVILEFDGGSIKNGTLVGNDTLMLNTNETESILDNVTLGGTWKESSYDLVEEVVADKAPGDGMGRIILRKDKTFAEQLTQENTIYVIRYDFVLDGDVTIPANCVLQFEGGSISGAYNITGNNTGIQAGLVKIFDTDITIAGSWNVSEAYPEWFGADGKETTVANLMITKASQLGKIVILTGIYYFPHDSYSQGGDIATANVVLKHPSIKGLSGSKLVIDANFQNTEKDTVIDIAAIDNPIVEGVTIEYKNYDYSGWTGIQSGTIRAVGCGGLLKISNCTIRRNMSAFCNVGRYGSKTLEEIEFINNYLLDGDCGLIIQAPFHFKKVLVQNNVFYKEKLFASEPVSLWNNDAKYDSVIIKDNFFKMEKVVDSQRIFGEAIYAGRGNILALTLEGNKYENSGAATILNAQTVTVSNEMFVASTFFDNNSQTQPRRSIHVFVDCGNVRIVNSLLSGLSVTNSVVTIENTEISELLEKDFINKDDSVTNSFYNYPMIIAENSKIVGDRIKFSQSKEGYIYFGKGIRLLRNTNSEVSITNVETIMNFPRYSESFNYRFVRKGNKVVPALFENRHYAAIGDFIAENVEISGQTVKVVSPITSYNDGRKKVRITVNTQPSNEGILLFNLNGNYVRVPVTPNTSGYATPADAAQQILGHLINYCYNYYSVGGGLYDFCFPYEPTAENTTVDVGSTGMEVSITII